MYIYYYTVIRLTLKRKKPGDNPQSLPPMLPPRQEATSLALTLYRPPLHVDGIEKLCSNKQQAGSHNDAARENESTREIVRGHVDDRPGDGIPYQYADSSEAERHSHPCPNHTYPWHED